MFTLYFGTFMGDFEFCQSNIKYQVSKLSSALLALSKVLIVIGWDWSCPWCWSQWVGVVLRLFVCVSACSRSPLKPYDVCTEWRTHQGSMFFNGCTIPWKGNILHVFSNIFKYRQTSLLSLDTLNTACTSWPQAAACLQHCWLKKHKVFSCGFIVYSIIMHKLQLQLKFSLLISLLIIFSINGLLCLLKKIVKYALYNLPESKVPSLDVSF